MEMSLKEVIRPDCLYEVLRRVAQRPLCSELLHFVLAVRVYTLFSKVACADQDILARHRQRK